MLAHSVRSMSQLAIIRLDVWGESFQESPEVRYCLLCETRALSLRGESRSGCAQRDCGRLPESLSTWLSGYQDLCLGTGAGGSATRQWASCFPMLNRENLGSSEHADVPRVGNLIFAKGGASVA